jgi:hypothetical protein
MDAISGQSLTHSDKATALSFLFTRPSLIKVSRACVGSACLHVYHSVRGPIFCDGYYYLIPFIAALQKVN